MIVVKAITCAANVEGLIKLMVGLRNIWQKNITGSLQKRISKNSKQDRIAIYRSSFMKCALILRDTNDAYKLGDGDRILRNSKFEMLCADVGKHTNINYGYLGLLLIVYPFSAKSRLLNICGTVQ